MTTTTSLDAVLAAKAKLDEVQAKHDRYQKELLAAANRASYIKDHLTAAQKAFEQVKADYAKAVKVA
jgi:predicted  nucleic acid-binding Zn-ribbon protein